MTSMRLRRSHSLFLLTSVLLSLLGGPILTHADRAQLTSLDDLHIQYQIGLEHVNTPPGTNVGIRDAHPFDSGYVALDGDRRRVLMYDAELNWVSEWGSEGTGEGQLDNPRQLVVDSSNVVWVLDYVGVELSWHIDLFTLAGHWIGAIEPPDSIGNVVDMALMIDDSEDILLLGYGDGQDDYVLLRIDKVDDVVEQWSIQAPGVSYTGMAVVDRDTILVASSAGLLEADISSPNVATRPVENPNLPSQLVPRAVLTLSGDRVLVLTTTSQLLLYGPDGSLTTESPCEVRITDARGSATWSPCYSLSRLSDSMVLGASGRTAVAMDTEGHQLANDLNDRRSGYWDRFFQALEQSELHLDASGGTWLCCDIVENGLVALRRWTASGIDDLSELEFSTSRRSVSDVLGSTLEGEPLLLTMQRTRDGAWDTDTVRLERYSLDGQYRGQYRYLESARDDYRIGQVLDLGEGDLLLYGFGPDPDGPRGRIVSQNGIAAECCIPGEAENAVGSAAAMANGENGEFLIADSRHRRVQRYSRDGAWVASWPTHEMFDDADLILSYPISLATLSDGNVFSHWRVFDAEDQSFLRYDTFIGRADGSDSTKVPSELRPGPIGSVPLGNATVRGESLLLGGIPWTVLGQQPRPHWLIEHFDNGSLSGSPSSVVTNTSASELRLQPPPESLAGWTTRATRELRHPRGAYELTLSGVNNARLWIDGELVVDTWLTDNTSPTAHWEADGEWVWMRLEIRHAAEAGEVRLNWSLLPTATPTATDTQQLPTDTPTELATVSTTQTPLPQDKIWLPWLLSHEVTGR